MRLIIHAPFIYLGGGRSLLVALLRSLQEDRCGFVEIVALVDERFDAQLVVNSGARILASMKPSLFSWFCAERKLAAETKDGDLVLCLGSLPSLYKTKGFVATFVQNTYVASIDPGFPLTWKQRLVVDFQQMRFRAARHHTDIFLVQTASMRDRLMTRAGISGERIMVTPFIDESVIHPRERLSQNRKQWDFGYVSLPWPHKNHRRLIQAFVMLAEAGITPSLAITVPAEMDPDLANWVSAMKKEHGIQITNLGQVPEAEIGTVYETIGALIFPSLSESFALPLLEATAYGLPILAPERDYVRDVVVPSETFDPESPRSIMRAILRHLGKPERPEQVPDAHEFMNVLLRAAKSSRTEKG